MERLTLAEAIKYTKEIARANRVEAENYIPTTGPYCNANLECANQYEQISMWLKELKSYKEAEEQGLLVRLPYNNGTLYSVNYSNKTITENTIIEIAINGHAKRFSCLDDNLRERKFYDYMIGENVFLNREEAEKKLEEMKK